MDKEETTTRKRGYEVDRRSKKLRVVVEEVATADDEEVEEFFAILRRMHDAVKYFGGGSKVASGVKTVEAAGDTVAELTPSAVAVDTPPELREETKASHELLDLNSAPEPSNGD